MKALEIDLVLANFDEVYSHGVGSEGRTMAPSRGLWQKAVLVPEQEGYVLVAPAIPSNLKPMDGVWFAPRRVILPLIQTGRLCQDLLRDKAGWACLVAELAQERLVRIWAQVFSPGVEAVVESLFAAGIEVITTELPRVSGHTVAFWNTKIGGREVLQSVPEVRVALPAAIICNTLVEVITLVATADRNKGLVVKANPSIGGRGVSVFPPGGPRSLDEMRDQLTTSLRKDKASSKLGPPTEEAGPYLVEEMVGMPGVHVSPTADFWIWGDGQVEVIGIARQLLADGIAYRGCSYPVPANHSQVVSCLTLGRHICVELYRRGYRGPVNVDFMLSDHGDVFVTEMNLRQSAPFDQFLLMRRLFGEGWEQRKAYICEEGVRLDSPLESTEGLGQLLLQRLRPEAGEMVCPLAIYGDNQVRVYEASLLSIADSPSTVERLVTEVRSAVGEVSG